MDIEVAVIGGGAAGIAAARRLHEAGIPCLIVEARNRLGGRAWTLAGPGGAPLDLGCGWMHSGDRNPWCEIAKRLGNTVDTTSAPWIRRALTVNFSAGDQSSYRQASAAFYTGLEQAATRPQDVPASSLVDPKGRWTPLLNAVSTYISGAELDRVSAQDLAAYDDTGVNWRVVEGYGATIAAYGAGLPAMFDCPVHRIDHRGKRLRIETRTGVIEADKAIVTVPSQILAEEAIKFVPDLNGKTIAAAGLPLGLADKLFLSFEGADEFDPDSRVFGRTDRAGTGAYHIRPFGRPIIEAYYAGTLAADLERGGEAAFFDFAISELTGVFGGAFARLVKPVGVHRWRADPFARGSYSYALPGMAGYRAVLAEPIDGRLFFAGEACSEHDYSTAHGAYRTGIAAAEQVIASRGSAA